MKKLFWMPLAVLAVFALAFVGCGGGDDVVAVTDVTLDKAEVTLTPTASTAALAATVAPDDATNKNLTWTSSDPEIATVTAGADGLTATVTRVNAGLATITVASVSNPDKTATCGVISEGLNLSAYSGYLKTSEPLEITARMIPSSASTTYTAESSDTTIASVAVAGDKITITAVATGYWEGDDEDADPVIITVTSGDYTAEFEVLGILDYIDAPDDGVLFEIGTAFAYGVMDNTNTGSGGNGTIVFTQAIDVREYDVVVVTFGDGVIEWWIGGVAHDFLTEGADEDWTDGESDDGYIDLPIKTTNFLGDIELSGGGGGGMLENLTADGTDSSGKDLILKIELK